MNRGHYWGMNPMAAEALHVQSPKRSYVVDVAAPKRTVAHEEHEFSLLQKVKRAKARIGKKLTKTDYLKAHRQTIRDGFP